MLALTLALALTQNPDPLLLPIGAPGSVTVRPGFTNLRTGEPATTNQIAAAADGYRFLLVGESHNSAAHHAAQAEIIEALVKRGRDVVVGLEMFTRDNQAALAPWTLGRWTEEQFIERANWKTQWGFDYALYRPIFESVRRHRLPMYALNAPRDWIRAIGREGRAALTPERKTWIPNLDTTNAEHRSVFQALIGGHPVAGERGENMYAAQVGWDTAMAQTALDAMAWRAGKEPIMVIVAGSGHVMYGQAINYRLKQLGGAESLSVVCIDSVGPRAVSLGLADYVFASDPPKED